MTASRPLTAAVIHAATAPASPAVSRSTLVLAAIVVGVLVLLVLAKWGDLLPYVAMAAFALVAIFVVPRIPGSPLSFMNSKEGMTTWNQFDWVLGIFAGVAAILSEGSRLMQRRRRRRAR